MPWSVMDAKGTVDPTTGLDVHRDCAHCTYVLRVSAERPILWIYRGMCLRKVQCSSAPIWYAYSVSIASLISFLALQTLVNDRDHCRRTHFAPPRIIAWCSLAPSTPSSYSHRLRALFCRSFFRPQSAETSCYHQLEQTY